MDATSRRTRRGQTLLSRLSYAAAALGALGASGVALSACLSEYGTKLSDDATSSSTGASSSAGGGTPGSTSGTAGGGGVGGGTGGMGGVGSGTGSTGGSGGTGGVGGSGPVTIREWDVETAKKVGTPLTYNLDGWMTIECATVNRTSQSGATTLVTGYGLNAARPRSVGKGWGLSVESKRVNKIRWSDSWTATSDWADGQKGGMDFEALRPDPSGSALATRFSSPGTMGGGKQSKYQNSVPGYASAWLKGEGGGDKYAYLVSSTAGEGWSYATVDTGVWKRYGFQGTEGYFRLEARADPPNGLEELGPTVVVAYGAQVEVDGTNKPVKYPGSYIPTVGVERAREADRLRTNVAAELLPGGYLDVKISIALNYASTEPVAEEHDILFIDSDNRIFFDLKQSRLVLRTAGVELVGQGPIVWGREEELTVVVRTSSAGRQLILNGAKSGMISVKDAKNMQMPTDQPIYILGNASGAQESADLRYIGFVGTK